MKDLPIVAIYDNEGRSFDRYTVVLTKNWDVQPPDIYPGLHLSDNPDSPRGISQWGECKLGDHLGKKIEFEDLPENVRNHIKARVG